jgi:hypothetical protein
MKYTVHFADETFEPVWDSCDNHRVVFILDEDDEIAVDGFGGTE